MTMNKKGVSQTVGVVITLAMGIFVIFLLSGNLSATNKVFNDAIGACEAISGICKSPACGSGEELLPAGKKECSRTGETYVCCTSDEIKESIITRTVLPGSNRITLSVNNRADRYTSGENVEVNVGRENSFKFDLSNSDVADKYCVAKIVDDSGDALVTSGGEGPCEDIEFKETFTQADSNRDLKVKISAYEDKEAAQVPDSHIVSAEFRLRFKSPITILIPDGWFKQATVEVRCPGGGCEDLAYYLVPDKNECVVTGDENRIAFDEEVRVPNVLLEFDQESKWVAGHDVVDDFVCVDVKMDTSETRITAVSPGTLRLDYEKPVITGVDELNILCDDNAGSGCDEIYYNIIPVYTEQDLESQKGVDKIIVQNFLNDAASNLINDLSKCPAPGRDYSVLRQGQPINTGNVVVGGLCIYSEDFAGNVGDRAIYPFQDQAAINRIVGDEIKDTISDFIRDLT